MLKKSTRFFNTLAERFLPDAFIFALLLSMLVFVIALMVTESSAIDLINYWGNGFDDLFKFAMEMTLILVTGFTLARSRLFSWLLDKIAYIPKNSSQAILMATLISCIACWLNWGFGLIIAGLFSVELAKRMDNLNFPLLVAASYSGFLVWHGGLSGSIPLKLTSPSAGIKTLLMKSQIGLDQTIFSSFNVTLLAVHIIALLVLNFLLNKQSEQTYRYKFDFAAEKPFEFKAETPAQKLENSRWPSLIIAFMGFCYLGSRISMGQGINLNFLILFFFFAGILLHSSPKQYLHFFSESVKDSSGIILQFPFYAGIMGVMRDSGMAAQLSEFFVSISTKETFLMYTYWSAGIVNFFVPSGGGQWVLQAPFILPAAKELGVSLSKASMAIAWGDAWTNMVQPFWAIPLLSVARLPLKAIMGYCVSIFFCIGLITSLYFYLSAI